MPLYLIERQFAEKLQMSAEGVEAIGGINEQAGVEWLYSFLSADQTKTYCLYQASDPADLRKAAEMAGIPADKIVEVSKFDPNEALA